MNILLYCTLHRNVCHTYIHTCMHVVRYNLSYYYFYPTLPTSTVHDYVQVKSQHDHAPLPNLTFEKNHQIPAIGAVVVLKNGFQQVYSIKSNKVQLCGKGLPQIPTYHLYGARHQSNTRGLPGG